MLVVFKSAPILKRALKVKQAMMQLYVLKLLKIQTKYLGRQWRKSNMKTMSAIYQKVRHRLNDDWAYGNGKKKKILTKNNYFLDFRCIYVQFKYFFCLFLWWFDVSSGIMIYQVFVNIYNDNNIIYCHWYFIMKHILPSEFIILVMS